MYRAFYNRIISSINVLYLITIIFLLQEFSFSLSMHDTPNVETTSSKLVFISDTQSPIWIETIWLDKNNNELATGKIFQRIKSEKPAAVFHLGDMVTFGFLPSAWNSIDTFVGQLYKQGITFFPVLGNHELLIFSKTGERNFQKRFPDHVRTGYAVCRNDIGIILLNSSFGILSKNEYAQQQIFLMETIEQFDLDTTLSAIVVCCHHSPYTNGKIVGQNEEVKINFVPYYLKSKKCKAFISGHSHGFEHFKIEGKHFLVIGGGGGLQHPHYIGEEAKWHDYYSMTLIKRNFHFVTCEIIRDMLVFKLYMLNDDLEVFIDDYIIEIPL